MKNIIFFVMLLITACSSENKTNVTINLPEKYTGLIWIKENKNNNEMCKEGPIYIGVNSEGLADISSDCFDRLKGWCSYETNLKYANHFLYDIGTVNQFRVFYYGDQAGFEATTRSKSIFDSMPK